MSDQRITINQSGDGPGWARDAIDEIVLCDSTLHFEMLSNCFAYLHVVTPTGELQANLYARPTTRAERRDILRCHGDRLVDHLSMLNPARWRFGHPRYVGWAVPIHRRPAATVAGWWEARRYAGAVLAVVVSEDTGAVPGEAGR